MFFVDNLQHIALETICYDLIAQFRVKNSLLFRLGSLLAQLKFKS